MSAHEKKIASWKAMPLPYCVTRYDANLMRGRPFGTRRFATVDDALDFALRNESRSPHLLMVDFAGAYKATHP